MFYVPFCQCMSPYMQHSSALTGGSLSEPEGYYITMYPVEKLQGLD